MSNTILNTRISLRIDDLSNWTDANLVLNNGEVAIVRKPDGTEHLKIGNGLSTFNQLPYYEDQFASKTLHVDELRAKTIAQGFNVKSTPTSFATGVFSQADGNFTVVHGIEAKSKTNDDYSFVFNGQNKPGYGVEFYESHGEGSFNINPLSGLSGFYIGEKNLDTILADQISAKMPDGYNISVENGIASALTEIRDWEGDPEESYILEDGLINEVRTALSSLSSELQQQINVIVETQTADESVINENTDELEKKTYIAYSDGETPGIGLTFGSTAFSAAPNENSALKKLNMRSNTLNVDFNVVASQSDISSFLEKSDFEMEYSKDDSLLKLSVDDRVLTAQIESGGESRPYTAGYGLKLVDHEFSLSAIIPLSTSQLINDSGFLTEHQSLNDYWKKSETSSKVEISNALTALSNCVDIEIASLSALNKTQFEMSYVSADNQLRLSVDDRVLTTEIKAYVTPKEYVGGKGIKVEDHVISLSDTIPLSTSQLINDSGFLTSHQSLEDYYLKTETSSSIQISTEFNAKVKIGNYKDEVYNLQSRNLSVVNIAADDYYTLIAEGKQDNNVVYVISSDNLNAHGQTIINVAIPELSSDAANKQYVDLQISANQDHVLSNVVVIDKKLVFQFNKDIQPISLDISSFVPNYDPALNKLSTDISALSDEISVIADDYLDSNDKEDILNQCLEPNEVKLYRGPGTKDITLSVGSGYQICSYTATLSDMYLTSETSSALEISTSLNKKITVGSYEYGQCKLSSMDLSVIRIPVDEYKKLVAKDRERPDVMYVVSSDYIEAFGQQLCNLTMSIDPVSSEAATKHYVDQEISKIPQYSISAATSEKLGGVKIGYAENNKNYAVKLDNEKAYVTVPWENTTYTADDFKNNFLSSTTTLTAINNNEIQAYAKISETSSSTQLTTEFSKYQLLADMSNYSLTSHNHNGTYVQLNDSDYKNQTYAEISAGIKLSDYAKENHVHSELKLSVDGVEKVSYDGSQTQSLNIQLPIYELSSALKGKTYDFSDNKVLYLGLRDILSAMGATTINFPSL